MKIFMLWAMYAADDPQCDHEHLLGVYSTIEKAEEANARQLECINDAVSMHRDVFYLRMNIQRNLKKKNKSVDWLFAHKMALEHLGISDRTWKTAVSDSNLEPCCQTGFKIELRCVV